MMHKKDYAFWSVVMVAGAVGATAVLNVSNLQSAPSQNADIYRKIDLFGEVFERVRQDYVEKPDEGAMIESAINGMLAALDPHSSYMPPKDYRDMQVQTRGEFGGLGIEVTMENGVIKVVSPIDDTPAAKAGLQANDLITHLDNEQIVGLTLQQAVDKMRGPVNTPITLTIVRKGKDEPFDVKVTRDVIHINAVKQRTEKDVAYIKVSTFNEQTHTNLVKAMESLKTSIGADLKGYVIDLRNNPGGLLDQAIAVSDDFLDRGAIVLTKGRDNAETQRAQARPGDMSDGKPVVILINGGSASASEIVAGALQDHKRATVIGTRSFGKGSVQTIIPLGNNEGAIRLTTARYYTPSNRSIQAKGIDPDVVVEQELPEELKGKNPERPRGEASLRGHLRGEEKKAEDKKAEEAKAAAAKSEAKPADPAVKPEGEDGDDEGAMVKPDEKKEVSGSSSYVPKEPEKDTQLQYALNLLRGNVVGAAALAQPSTPPSANPASPPSGDKAAVPN
jgi:carboxyl-terminal processing protease